MQVFRTLFEKLVTIHNVSLVADSFIHQKNIYCLNYVQGTELDPGKEQDKEMNTTNHSAVSLLLKLHNSQLTLCTKYSKQSFSFGKV